MNSKLDKLVIHRFAGVCLGGGKTDRTAVAIVEFYPAQQRIFLRGLREKIKSEKDVSADLQLHMILTESETDLESITFDVPLQLPVCVTCRLKCPGYEECEVSQVQWMWDLYRKRSPKKRPNKLFTPYTERCAEMYISSELEEPFFPSHTLGANAAPLVARAQYIRRRLDTAKIPIMEAYPRLSIWRIGRALGVAKSHLRYHKHSIEGDESRFVILKSLVDNQKAFIYQQDLRSMVENNSAFEAFICALTGFLKFRGQTEQRPAGYPESEAWIEFPKQNIDWF